MCIRVPHGHEAACVLRYLSRASDTSASPQRSRLASTAPTAMLQNAPYRFSRGLCVRCTESQACIVTRGRTGASAMVRAGRF